MALQSSGPISISDIQTELGSSSGSLRNLSAAAGFTVPDAISEFYGYSSYSNDYFYRNDGVNDYVSGTWSILTNLSTGGDWTIRFWVRQNGTTKSGDQLWDFNANTTFNSNNTNNRVFLQYNSFFNRFIVRIRSNSVNFDKQVALHDNSGATGITNSSTGWVASQRGNVNGDGFCMVTVTYDASQSTAANAIKIYWNASELTTSAVTNNGTRTAMTAARLTLGASAHAITSGNSQVDIDEWAFYSGLLTSTQVTALYNSGVIVDAKNINSTNLETSIRFGASNALDIYGPLFTNTTVSGGSTIAY